MSQKPLIALVHAVPDSMPAATSAFEAVWPGADVANIIDESLFHNLKSGRAKREAVVERFQALTEFALSPTTDGRRPQAILYCCSAFAYAIERARAGRSEPILTPAEAGIEDALDAGRKIGLVVSAEAALAPLVDEFADIAARKGRKYELVPIVAHGAIEALREGRVQDHDLTVERAIEEAKGVDVVLMGQFTMSRAATRFPKDRTPRVLTTPGSAVRKLRSLLAGD
jgi:hypothetical protein